MMSTGVPGLFQVALFHPVTPHLICRVWTLNHSFRRFGLRAPSLPTQQPMGWCSGQAWRAYARIAKINCISCRNRATKYINRIPHFSLGSVRSQRRSQKNTVYSRRLRLSCLSGVERHKRYHIFLFEVKCGIFFWLNMDS